MGISFVGLGLGPKGYLTLAAIDALKDADKVLLDTYTGILPHETIEFIRSMCKDVKIADRSYLEDRMMDLIEEGKSSNIAIAVQGDPMIATTHVSILLEAIKHGLKCKVIHGVSSYSAAISASGLHVYKFGRSITLPKDCDINSSISSYEVISQNMSLGMHTLVFLDTKDGGMNVRDALSKLLEMEERSGKGIINRDSLAISIAKLGYEDCKIKAGTISKLMDENFPNPPHILILPSDLHFLERDVLTIVHGAEVDAVRSYRARSYVASRIKGYQEKCDKVFRTMTKLKISKEVDRILEVAESYKEDSKFFLDRGDVFNALSAISYCEGLLDALKMLGFISFEW